MYIERIENVLPFVEGRSDFVVKYKPDYTVIDYLYCEKDTFDHPMRVECRGLKFDASGRILARPFHKFFNIGETEFTQAHVLNFSDDHIIMEKMDGSMVHPALVRDEVVFMTRMGHTDVAQKAERHLTDPLVIVTGKFST